MGNCIRSGMGGSQKLYHKNLIRVVTPNGGVMELQPPIFAHFITNEFPDHVIHKTLSMHQSSPPLRQCEELFPGNTYYLIPLSSVAVSTPQQHSSEQLPSPYRMSPVNAAANGDGGRSGVWKVKLVISPEQLAGILSEDGETEVFVGSVRTVARYGGHGGGALRSYGGGGH